MLERWATNKYTLGSLKIYNSPEKRKEPLSYSLPLCMSGGRAEHNGQRTTHKMTQTLIGTCEIDS